MNLSLPLAVVPGNNAHDHRFGDERLGFFDRKGNRICPNCYFRLSKRDEYVRILLTRIVNPILGEPDVMVSTIWLGTDPHAIEEKRGPAPFCTATYSRSADLEPTVTRSIDERSARLRHRSEVQRVCSEGDGRAFDLELGDAHAHASSSRVAVGVR